jgi:hypothetical protein
MFIARTVNFLLRGSEERIEVVSFLIDYASAPPNRDEVYWLLDSIDIGLLTECTNQ